MAIITTGNAFGATDPVTSTTLNNIANAATFNDPVDETSLELITSGVGLIGKLGIKDGGVTKAKIENVANLRVLGNTSGSVVAPQEVEILDDDTMATADAATLATSESIKAYVDSSSITQTTGTAPYYGVRAWCHYNGSSQLIKAQGNISSVTRHNPGDYEFFFTEEMSSSDYAISLSYSEEVNVHHGVGFVVGHTTTSFRVQHYNPTNSGNNMDKAYVGVSVIG